jgi:hypothetical protein
VNGRNQPNIGAEVIRELASTDSVDLLSAFIKWQGVRLVEGRLRALPIADCRHSSPSRFAMAWPLIHARWWIRRG